MIDDKKMIKYIVLCEDKCSEDARNIITAKYSQSFEILKMASMITVCLLK